MWPNLVLVQGNIIEITDLCETAGHPANPASGNGESTSAPGRPAPAPSPTSNGPPPANGPSGSAWRGGAHVATGDHRVHGSTLQEVPVLPIADGLRLGAFPYWGLQGIHPPA